MGLLSHRELACTVRTVKVISSHQTLPSNLYARKKRYHKINKTNKREKYRNRDREESSFRRIRRDVSNFDYVYENDNNFLFTIIPVSLCVAILHIRQKEIETMHN